MQRTIIPLLLFFSFGITTIFGQVKGAVEHIEFKTCGTVIPVNTVSLGAITINETSSTDFNTGTFTFYIQAPSGFEINASIASSSGSDINSVTVTQEATNRSRLKVNFSVIHKNSIDELKIENVTLIPIASASSTNGRLSYSHGTNTNAFNGLNEGALIGLISFSTYSGGQGLNQNLCSVTDLQNISIVGSDITASRTYKWEKEINGNWSTISGATNEILIVNKATFPKGKSQYRRLTSFTLNGSVCTLTSTPATIIIHEIYPGTITEGNNQSICTGQTPQQLSSTGDIAVTNTGSSSYQWYKNDTASWELIPGATSNFYQPAALTTTTSYKRRITNTIEGFSCFEETPAVTITVNSSVVGGTATSQSICSINELQLLTINNGNNSGSYQWQKKNGTVWQNIPGATQSGYNARSNISPGISKFRRVTTVSGASCEGISTEATIKYTNFSVGEIRGNATICLGETPNTIFSQTAASGTGTISYQWETYNGTQWSAISGATIADYQPTALTSTKRFRRIDNINLDGSQCSESTNEVEITVLPQISGGTASNNQTLCAGETPTTISISGATPAGQGISFQWQFATSDTYSNMAGETNESLSFSTAPSQTTSYRRQTFATKNGKVCSALSTVATIFINKISIGTISNNQSICLGEAVQTLTNLTNTTAEGSLSYRWESSTNNGSSWNVIAGETGSTLSPGSPTVNTMFKRLDRSTLNGVVCEGYTNAVTVQVEGEILGGTLTSNQVVCSDEVPAELIVTGATASGVGVTYQWYSSNDNSNYNAMPGETGERLSFASNLNSSTYFKRNTISASTGSACTAFSNSILISVIQLESGSIGTTQTFCGNSVSAPLTSTADAVSNATINYSWESSLDGNTWTTVAGASQATYTPTNITAVQTYFRRVVSASLSGTTCKAFTTPVIIHVNKFNNINTHRITFASGDTGTTTICNGGTPPPFIDNNILVASGNVSYQWQQSTDNITFTNIPGATRASFSAPSITQDIYYRRVNTSILNGVSCTYTTNTLSIINGGNADSGTIGTTNANGTHGTNEEVVCPGDTPSALIELTPASGQTLSYQWYANAVPIAGATEKNYTPTTPITATTTFVRVTTSTDISMASCEVYSNEVVVLAPSAFDIGTDITLCTSTTSGKLGDTATIEGINYLTFQWYQSSNGASFNAIPGATNATYTPSGNFTTDQWFRRGFVTTIGARVCGAEVLSNTIRIIINEVDGGTILGNQEICYAEDPSFMNSASEGTGRGVLTYQWYSSEDNATWATIENANNSTYDPVSGENPTTYYKRTTISTLNDVACSADSNTITVGIAEELLLGILTANQTLCLGESPTTLTTSGSSNYADQVFSWYSSADGQVWTDLEVTTASYTPPLLTRTTKFKRRITRTSLNNLTCFKETESITIAVNSVEAGSIKANQSICQGDQPDALVEVIEASGVGSLSYSWWASEDNQIYAELPGATQSSYTPPTTLTTSTYFKRRVTSSLNGVNCFDETSPILITVIPYAIIDNESIIDNDITMVSCYQGSDGSIQIPNSRITGGNTAQKQINTITFSGTTEIGVTYSIIIDGIAFEHTVQLNGANVPQTSSEIANALATKINAATGANVRNAIASTAANQLILTAKTSGIGFQSYASTGSSTMASASNVITQENAVANVYEWAKIGDPSFAASTLSISDITAGVYQLTVYNQFCARASSLFIVEEPEELVLSLSDTCNSAVTANVTGGVSPYTYTLNHPDGTQTVETTTNNMYTFTGLIAGATYSVKVKDDRCNNEEVSSVILPFGLKFNAASVEVNNISCFEQNDGSIRLDNGVTTVSGGYPPYNYSWTAPNGGVYTTPNLSNLAPGVYQLEVTDQIGCSANFIASIASKSELSFESIQLTNENLQCAGEDNAEVSIKINSDPSAQIQISWYKNGTNYATNNTTLTNLSAGSYEVVVTDTNSNPNAPCLIRYAFEVIAPQPFTASKADVGSSTITTCDLLAGNRSLTIKVSGGTPPYKYTVDSGTPVSFNTLQTIITNLSNNSHVITVTDSNSCQTETFLMDYVTPLRYLGTTDFTISSCEIDTDLSLVTSLIEGGTPLLDASNNPYYLYEWTGPNGFRAQDITTIKAEVGTYHLTITDANNCASEQIAFNFEPTYPYLEVEEKITPVSCGETSDGAITISIDGGLRPYTILWEKEQTGTEENPNASYVTIAANELQLTDLEEGRVRLTVISNINACLNTDQSYYYQKVFTIPTAESIQLLDGPYFDEALCLGNPGSITLSVFNSQAGDLSFYYADKIVPATKTDANEYSVQIANPVSEADLYVVNNQGCGFTVPTTTGIVEPSLTITSNEFETTGLFLAKEDIKFNNTSEPTYNYAVWNFGDGTAQRRVDADADGTQIIHNYQFAGVFEVSLTLFNNQNCSKEIKQTITVGKGYDILFPNVFSANNDGINDYFQGEFVGIASFQFEIYDMWGALVYAVAHDFETMPTYWGWDGTFSSGKPYEYKSFRYVFIGTTRDNSQVTKSGEATILR